MTELASIKHQSPVAKQTHINPIPVTGVLIPVDYLGDTHLVTIIRNTSIKRGGISLPGGYIENNQTGMIGASDEAYQETGIAIPPNQMSYFDEFSSKILQKKLGLANSTLILMYHCPKVPYPIINRFHQNREIMGINLVRLNDTEDGLVNEYDEEVTLSFASHHTSAVRFLNQQRYSP